MKEVFNMFTSDVTQTYDHLDASAEILIMLLGAFLLGCLLCWLLRQYLVNNTVKANNGYPDTRSETQATQAGNNNRKAQPNIAKKTSVRDSSQTISKKSTNTKPASNKRPSLHKNISDFKIINGITPNIENLLRDKNINSYSDLRDIDNKTLNEMLSSSVTNESTKQSVKTWSHQAALAAKGDWRKLSEYQDFIEQAMLSEKDISKASPENDDLQKIKGIGPQITKILNREGIHTFKQLRQADAETLKEHISNADKRFKNNQTSTWSHQASMAEKKQWKELAIYQEFMDDINIDSENLAATINKTSHTPDSLSLMGKNIDTSRKSTKNDKSFINDDFETSKSANPKSSSSDKLPLDSGSTIKKSTSIDHESTKKVEHKSSSKNKPSENKQNYNSIANKPSNNTQQNSDKSLKDDLKIIEGIGPKIEEVLNKAKIHTFSDLKQSNRDILKSLLNEAGPQYRMHEPETWPLQAEIAHNKEWDKLKEYQDFLSRGREE